MHKLIITTYNHHMGGLDVTVLEFDNKIQAKALYDALTENNKTFPLNRILELCIAGDMA